MRAATIIAVFLFVGIGCYFLIQQDVTKIAGEQVPYIHGQQHFQVQVQYPKTQKLPNKPVEVKLLIDSHPILTVTKPSPDGWYHLDWDSAKYPNGGYLLDMQARWGTQLIGEQSKRVIIAN